MLNHGFDQAVLDEEKYKLIDSFRLRTKRNFITKRDFLNLEVVKEIWTGFFKSEEMTKFVKVEIKDKTEEYIAHL